MSLFDWLADKDDRVDDWPPPGPEPQACELCGGAGRIVDVDDDYMPCPECDGSGWAQEDDHVKQ